jgi:Dyp-type peroxidase family
MAELTEPVLETNEIQGNVIPGFNKSHQFFLGYRILDPTGAKAWIRLVAPEITSADEVVQFRILRARMIARRGYEPAPEELAVVWLNVAFSAPGLRRLVDPATVDDFEDTPFKNGLHARATTIGDPADQNDIEGSPKNWKVGGTPESTPDIFLIIAGDRAPDVQAKAGTLKAAAENAPSGDGAGPALELLYEEQGDDLPGELSGHEHFGFKDGISQPGVRGRFPEPPHDFVTPRLIDPQDPLASFFGKPGQPLVWPGQFLFGYARQHDLVPTATMPPREAPDWAKNGSFLVFRRLRQDVSRFWRFIEDTAAQLAASEPGFEDLDAVKLASMLVGRWPSGAPVMRTPDADNPELAEKLLANHFGFDQPSRRIPFDPQTGIPPDTLPLAPGDRDGFVCPHATHIRKVNPRDIATDQGNSVDTLQRRILRRGIPFGRVLEDHDHPETDPEQGNRGLLFVSYQTSILDQFEFLAKNWMNKRQAPEENPGGHDLIVGQNSDPGQSRKRTCTLRRKKNGQEFEATIEVEGDWVIPTGGGYFFTPSISTLREVIQGNRAMFVGME